MSIKKSRIKDLPNTPGVYFFLAGKKILYIGKATSLKSRVNSYFSNDLMSTRGPIISKMIEEADEIKWEQTDSVLEALILEAYYIKEKQPPYNSKEKDNKSFNYVVITEEDFPRVLIVRGRELSSGFKDLKFKATFGPFPSSSQLKEALRIIRKIFPYRDKCQVRSKVKSQKLKARDQKTKIRPCFNRQLGLCPGVCTGEINKRDYAKNIRHIRLFLSGKKKTLIRSLEKEMKNLASKREFEKAEVIKRQIFSLNHIRDVSLLKKDFLNIKKKTGFRIEAYDIAHISGSATVGVMVVVSGGEIDKAEYRKFRIRGKGEVSINDTKNLQEVLERRLGYSNWQLPNVIVVDGGVAQINAAKEILKLKGFNIEVISVVKDERHKAKEIIGKRSIIQKYESEILLANSEAHRFAINYHRSLLRKGIRK